MKNGQAARTLAASQWRCPNYTQYTLFMRSVWSCYRFHRQSSLARQGGSCSQAWKWNTPCCWRQPTRLESWSKTTAGVRQWAKECHACIPRLHKLLPTMNREALSFCPRCPKRSHVHHQLTSQYLQIWTHCFQWPLQLTHISSYLPKQWVHFRKHNGVNWCL